MTFELIGQMKTAHVFIFCVAQAIQGIAADVIVRCSFKNEFRLIKCKFGVIISGTTEKIFEVKNEVYDAFVDNQNLILSEDLASVGKINNADRKRYQQLCTYRCVDI